MWALLRSTLIQSAVIVTVVLLWLSSSLIWPPKTTEHRTKFGSEVPDAVRFVRSIAAPFRRTLQLRGVTEAERRVEVRARTDGVLTSVPKEGKAVKESELLCQLEEDSRRAALRQDQAELRQVELDWEGIMELRKQGLSSKLEQARAEAALDKAKASIERSSLQLQHTQILAPFAALVDYVSVRVGDLLNPSAVCAVLLDLDPITIKTNISESDVDDFQTGSPVQVRLINGQEVEGKVTWISRSAQQGTRTFAAEIQVPNPDWQIRDGLSAQITIFGQSQHAHHVSPSALVFDDSGVLVVRTLDERNRVQSYPVELIQDSQDGLRIGGLPDEVRVITLGQHYVSDGTQVSAKEAEAPAG